MADTWKTEFGRFIEGNWRCLVRKAVTLGFPFPEDLVQATAMEILRTAPHKPVENWEAFFTFWMKRVIWEDSRRKTREGRKTVRHARPLEVHGDIDSLVRRQHGRRVGPKKGAE